MPDLSEVDREKYLTLMTRFEDAYYKGNKIEPRRRGAPPKTKVASECFLPSARQGEQVTGQNRKAINKENSQKNRVKKDAILCAMMKVILERTGSLEAKDLERAYSEGPALKKQRTHESASDLALMRVTSGPPTYDDPDPDGGAAQQAPSLLDEINDITVEELLGMI